jgi:hypothetical protein
MTPSLQAAIQFKGTDSFGSFSLKPVGDAVEFSKSGRHHPAPTRGKFGLAPVLNPENPRIAPSLIASRQRTKHQLTFPTGGRRGSPAPQSEASVLVAAVARVAPRRMAGIEAMFVASAKNAIGHWQPC